MTDARWDRLPCGRDKDHLLQVVADGIPLSPGSHEATCSYCQAALSELSTIWAPVGEWGKRAVPVPTDLVRTVIARVRRMTQSPHHVVESAAKGVTSVTSWVIALLSSEAARRVPGVAGLGGKTGRTAGSDHVREVRHGADDVAVTEVGAAAVSVEFAIKARPEGNFLQLADHVREEVIGELRRSASMEVSEIDLTIEEVILEKPEDSAEL